MWKWNLREGSLRALLNTAAEPRLSPTLHLFPWGLLLLHPGVLLVHRHHGQRRHARHHAVHGPVPAVPCNSVTCHVSRVTCGRVSPAGGGVLSAVSSECGMNSCSAGSELMKPISRSEPSPAHNQLSLHQPASTPCQDSSHSTRPFV